MVKHSRHDALEHASEIASEVAHARTEQALPSLSEEVGLLDLALGRVDVGQVEARAGVAPGQSAGSEGYQGGR